MKKEDLDYLNEAAMRAARGDVSAIANPRAAGLVLALLSEHEEVTRSENFWSDRAPKLNDEVLLLRQLEFPASVAVAGGKVADDRREEARKVLDALKALREPAPAGEAP